MAARYAKITIRASWSWIANTRGNQTTEVKFLLAGQWETYRRGPSAAANEFGVPAPNDVTPQDTFVEAGVNNLLALIRTTIQNRALFYTVSAPRFIAFDTSHLGEGTGVFTEVNPWPIVEFDIEATLYDPAYNLQFATPTVNGWSIFANLPNISPLTVSVTVQDAGSYGTATGSATLVATGNGAPYVYTWADGFVGDVRNNLAAGTYYCTVTDGLGESTRVPVIVKSDARLVVQVNNTTNSIDLVPSGGLPPYAYNWLDGATTASRTGLPLGTYDCVVSDARGATRDVRVVLSLANRYWFSGNPITLSLVATDPDTTSFVCEVWVEPAYGTGTFVLAGQALEQPADAFGATTFEVQELLEPYVAAQPPARRPLVAVPQAAGLFCRFYLKHYERSAAGDGASTSVDTNYLVAGGLGYQEAAYGTWFGGYQASQLPFLTWEPRTKKVLPEQPEYLYFMALDDLSGFQVRLVLHWENGTQTSAAGPGVGTAVLAHEIFCLPVGFQQLGLPALEAAAQLRLARYEVYVLGPADDVLSETRTFVLDRRPCPVRRYFLYANSLGGWNTLVCRGRGTRDVAIKTSASENARAAGYDPLRGDYTINRRTLLPTLHCYTGPRKPAQLLADQDFLRSDRVLLLEADGRYVAGQVKDRTVVVDDEDETRRVVQFDFELPRERYHTPRLTL